MFQVKADDGLLFPRLQPEITGNPTVVFIEAPVAASPVVELAGPHAQPVDESSGADLGFFRPAPDEIHHQVPCLASAGTGESVLPLKIGRASCRERVSVS